MGKLLNGPFGAVTGKIGHLVSYELRGQNIVRKNRTVKVKSSVNQLPGQLRIRVLNVFLKPLKHFINLGFLFEVVGKTRHQYNEASSYILNYAMKGEYPDISIDFEKVKLSVGTLAPANFPTVIKMNESIVINWDYDDKLEFHWRNDRAMIALCFQNTKQPIYFLSGSLRSEKLQIIDLDSETIIKPCHVYVSFFAEDRKSVSDSTYMYCS